MTVEIVTIGVFEFTEEGFFGALQAAAVDTFCDIRQRRGVRGSTYAFVNSQRLQARLADLGIHYIHDKALAPTPAVRERQHVADRASKTAKRQRTSLSPAFVAAYQAEILAAFDPQTWLARLPSETQVAALFCVEREAAACHRSLVAAKLEETLNITVHHLLPPSS